MALCRLSVFAAVSYSAWTTARNHVDSTPWAQNILQNLRLTCASYDADEDEQLMDSCGGTTPLRTANRYDVLLVEHWLGSSSHAFQGHMMFIQDGHPGNTCFQQLVHFLSQIGSNQHPPFHKNIHSTLRPPLPALCHETTDPRIVKPDLPDHSEGQRTFLGAKSLLLLLLVGRLLVSHDPRRCVGAHCKSFGASSIPCAGHSFDD